VRRLLGRGDPEASAGAAGEAEVAVGVLVAARILDGAERAGRGGERGERGGEEDGTEVRASSSSVHAREGSRGRAGPQARWYGRAVRSLGLVVLVSSLVMTGCGGGAAMGSVGAVFGRDTDTNALYVREAPPGLAAEAAGLLPGDQVVMIEGRYVRDLSEKEIRDELRGDVGTPVLLTILRGSEVRHVKVVRSELRAHNVLRPREQKIAE